MRENFFVPIKMCKDLKGESCEKHNTKKTFSLTSQPEQLSIQNDERLYEFVNPGTNFRR